MRCFYQEVPKFLGFQDISVMFYDYERELLYTITFGDDEDNLKDLQRKQKLAKSEKDLEYVNTIAAMKDAQLTGN